MAHQFDAHGDLSIAELIFFVPAFFVGIYILLQHGFSKKLGWFYLTLLSIFRIVGASCFIYIEATADYNQSMLVTAAITSAIGTAPLLLALLGSLERINDGMLNYGTPHGLFKLIHILSLAGLVLAIVGGINEGTPTATTSTTGEHLMRAASILFMTMCGALAFISVRTWIYRAIVLLPERKLLYAGLLALPWLFVRIAYSIIVAFANPESPFFYRNVGVYPKAFMQFLPEAVVVILFIIAGMLTPRMQRPENKVEEGKQSQTERSMGDYRPSRLVANAWRNRS